MLLSLEQGSAPKLLIELDSLGYLNVAGMPGGYIWSHGGTSEKDGEFESMTWEDLFVETPGTIVVRMVKIGKPTSPIEIKKRNVTDLLSRLKRVSDEYIHPSNNEAKKKPSADRITKSLRIEVLKNGKKVFDAKGEHVQFDIAWKFGEKCRIMVWGKRVNDLEDEFHYTDIVGENVFTLRCEG